MFSKREKLDARSLSRAISSQVSVWKDICHSAVADSRVRKIARGKMFALLLERDSVLSMQDTCKFYIPRLIHCPYPTVVVIIVQEILT